MRRAAGLLAGAASAAAAGAALVTTRWARAADPTGGAPLCLPDGEDLVVTAPDGARLATRVAGPAGGTAYLLAHCWTGDRRVWGPVANRLVDAGHRVVLFDHRGHGASTTGGAGHTIEALADDVRAVLEAVDVRGAVLAGHSLGGMAAQMFAVRHPGAARERLAGLVLVSTGCGDLRYGVLALVGTAAAVGRPGGRAMATPLVGRLLARAAVGRTACAAHLDAVCETFGATTPRARMDLLMAMDRLDLAAELPRLDLPVLVVHGTRDLITLPARARRLAALIPGARLEMVPGAGHLLPLEVPDLLAGLLASHAGAHATTRRAG